MILAVSKGEYYTTKDESMKKVRSLVCLMFVFCSSSYAEYDLSQAWQSDTSKDEFTGKVTYSATAYAGSFFKGADKKTIFLADTSHSLGIRCDIATANSIDFMFTFGVKDALATPNSAVSVLLKVDDNQPVELLGQLYSNSYREGFIRLTPNNRQQLLSVISQAAVGNKVLIRVYDEGKSTIENYSVLLKGFTKSTSEALKACAVNGEDKKLSDENIKRLTEIENEIKLLQSERDKIKAGY